MTPSPHQHTEHPAPDAVPERGFEAGRDDQHAEQDVGGERGPTPNQATDAPTVTTAPMPWANRFGGPGVSRGSIPARRHGVSTRVTNWPSGLNRGPASTRATKP